MMVLMTYIGRSAEAFRKLVSMEVEECENVTFWINLVA
jgi:hypothetical protein